MPNFLARSFIFSTCLFLVLGCNQNKNPEFNGVITAKSGKVLPKQIKSIFQSKCTPCHTSSGGALPNWLDYKTVIAKKDAIKARAIDIVDPTRPMPPAGNAPLTAEEKKAILDWIAAGTPGEAGVEEPTPTAPVPAEPVLPGEGSTQLLPANVKLVFESKCTPCHTTQIAGGPPYWLDYKTAFSKKDLIKARAIDISDPNRPMPPAGMPALTPEEKKTLSDWISAGAPPATGSLDPNAPPTIPEGTPVTFKDLIYPHIIKNRCEACHNANSDQSVMPNWALYSNAFAKKEKIMDRVFVKKDMPPVGMPISQEERNLIKKWIDSGAPEKLTEPTPPTPTAQVNFQEHIKPRVFMVYCSACHNAEAEKNNSKLKDWANYQKASTNKDLIFQRVFVEKDPSKRMPLGATLPDNESKLLRDWITAGAPEW